jgi:hypothetical protein
MRGLEKCGKLRTQSFWKELPVMEKLIVAAPGLAIVFGERFG